MHLIKQSFKILSNKTEEDILKSIEYAGRTCYKSYSSINDNSNKLFVTNIIKRGHMSVLEHEYIQLKMVVDRGVLGELTRHRIGIAFSVESTRYCNYSKTGSIAFIEPVDVPDDRKNIHMTSYANAENDYNELIALGATPQEARQVLPLSLATELVVTANIREWRHILSLRTTDNCHPHCKYIFREILDKFKELYPTLFGDIQ